MYDIRLSLRTQLCRLLFTSGIVLLPMASKAVEIVAHRGGYALAPENTVAAFQACAGYAEWIEFDVYATVDGQLAVIHDHTVDRTTDGTAISEEHHELRFTVRHAIAADRPFRVGYATNPAGPYAEQASSFSLEGDIIRSQIPASEGSGNNTRFYRIESP